MERLRLRPAGLSPIWAYPFFKQACLKIDWLHAADQGVTPCWIGSLFTLIVDPPGLEGWGSTLEIRCVTLWHMILAFYKEQGQRCDKLKALPLSSIQEESSCFKGNGCHCAKVGAFLRATPEASEPW